MDAIREEKARLALMRLDAEKTVKECKLREYFKNQRLALLLRLPFSVVKAHNSTKMSVTESGLLSFKLSDEIPLSVYLERDNAPTFEKWLEKFYPEDFKRYQADKMRFLFGSNTDLKHTDSTQRLYDEYDKFTWCRNEQERAYYFASLLDGVDVSALDEFALFGSVGGHTPQEISDFKAELISMQADYEKNPGAYFHPSADADSTGAVPPAVV
jgi:hypothetical protein